jgi:hypothetical protein
MNDFGWQQRPSKNTFANKTVFTHIPPAVARGMVRQIQQHITRLVHSAATLPPGMFGTTFGATAAHLKSVTLARFVYGLGTHPQKVAYLGHCFALSLIPRSHLLNRPINLVVATHAMLL